jgi:hypothetical protein
MAGDSDDPTSPPPVTAAVPTVRLLTVSTLFPGEKLDKELSNWIAWKQAMFQYMGTSRLIRYTKPNAKSFRPNQFLDPIGYDNWVQNDECACAYIHGAISANEHLALGSEALTEDAAALWALLEARHKDDGPVTQVSLIREAMGLRATADDFTTAPKEIVRIMERVFSMGPISNDTYTNFIILHSFSELQDMQFNIQDQLKMASKESPATPLTVLNYLREKQKIIDSNSSARTATSIALAARSTPSPRNNKSRQALFCTGCKGNTHTHPYCIREGGGMAGRSIEESKAQRRKDMEAAKGKASMSTNGGGTGNRVPVAHTDSNGKAFISYVDPSALYSSSGATAYANLASINTDEVVLSTEDLEHHAFAIIHHVDVASAYLHGNFPRDDAPAGSPSADDLPAWMTINGDITSSLDWNAHSRPADLAAVSASAPNQASRTVASSEEFPFYLDSGATTHLSPSREDFFSLRPIASRPVKGVGGTSIFAIGVGEVRLRIAHGAWIALQDVLFIPAATVRLISVGTIARDSKIVSHFDDTSCWLTSKSTGAVIARGTLLPRTRLYSLPLHSPQADHAYSVHREADLETWHRRLGHANYQCVAGMARKGKINGMSPSLATSKVSKCEPCVLGKQTKTIVPKTRGGKEGDGNRATRVLGVVWIDLTGPHAVTSRTGNRYTVDIVDDYTSRGWTFAVPKKSDAFDKVQAWEKVVKAETGQEVGTYRTDNGELKSNKMRAWLEGKGTKHEFTAPYTSAHCGRVERRHRTLMGKANAMRIYAQCPPNLWDEFYLTASFLDERTPTVSLNGGTPYEAYYNRPPDYSRLREIGCQAFVLILNRHNPKIYDRSLECVLIGYDLNAKTYRCYNRATKQVYSSYHVRFIESHEAPSPSLNPKTPSVPTSISEISQSATSFPTGVDTEEEETLPKNPRDPLEITIPNANPEHETLPKNPRDPLEITIPNANPEHPDLQYTPDDITISNAAPATDRRSSRIQNAKTAKAAGAPSRLDKVRQEVAESKARVEEARAEKKRKRLEDIREDERRNDPAKLDEAAKEEMRKDMESGTGTGGVAEEELTNNKPTSNDEIKNLRQLFENISLNERIVDAERVDRMLAAIADHSTIDPRTLSGDEPRDWEDSQRRSPTEAAEWRAAFEDEIKSLKDMGVYKLIPRSEVPEDSKVRRCKAVLKNKLDENGNLSRRKVRYVFKGFEQQYGKDYTSTTSPTARMESWRILLHIAAALDWDAQQIDVKTAFLYGLLPDDEVQYMEQPQGFEEKGKETWVWKLQKGLYGMKQAGRIWNKTMNEAMISWGFTRLACESCIYYRKTDSGIIISAVHVDDFLSIAHPPRENELFKAQMKGVWKISDLGGVKFCVGIAIARDRENRTISLSQTALIDRVITQFGQQDAYPNKTPMDPGLKLRRPTPSDISPEDQIELAKLPYRSLVGCLLYLSVASRPDITYAVQQLSQFLDSYSFAHWNAAIRVVRYLKGTRELKLILGGRNPVDLTGFTDSDWANCLDTRRSIGGYSFTLGSGVVSWSTRKQKTVASSSCEAEYTAAFECAKEAIWLRTLLSGIGFAPPGHTTILCDNNAAINLSEDPSLHQRVKHVDIKYHFLRERVHSNDLKLSYVNTNDNLADIFTKALDTTKFEKLRGFLGLG